MKHRAILIANWTYDEESGFESLNGPEADLDVLKGALVHPEDGLFEEDDVIVLRDRPAAEIKQELSDFLLNASKDDFLCIYFSGHGQPFRENLVLCTAKTPKHAPMVEGVDVRFINEILPESRSETTMCRLRSRISPAQCSR